MALFRDSLIWALVILVVGGVSAKTQSPKAAPVAVPAAAPGPGVGGTDCMTLIYGMFDCLTYVEQGSNVTKPDKACCPELKGMLDSNPICLCNLLGNSSDLPVQLDLKRALKLPSMCKLQTPPVSHCSEIGIPVGVPAGSPTSSQGHSSSSGKSPMGAGGMSPMAGMSPVAGMSPMAEAAGDAAAPSAGKNGVTNENCNLVYLIAGLVMAIASTSLLTI